MVTAGFVAGAARSAGAVQVTVRVVPEAGWLTAVGGFRGSEEARAILAAVRACLTDAPLFGRTRNAWSAERTSGGSSGGAAVAVAAGIGPIGIATDGGGSTRIPAAINGMLGLKQSNGVIPHSQVADAFGNYTYVTPMSRTVMDTALN